MRHASEDPTTGADADTAHDEQQIIDEELLVDRQVAATETLGGLTGGAPVPPAPDEEGAR